MNKKELHKFNNRFNSFALAFEQLKKLSIGTVLINQSLLMKSI